MKTYYAQAQETVAVWRKTDLQSCEAYFAISGEFKISATWDQVSDLIVGYLMASEYRQAA